MTLARLRINLANHQVRQLQPYIDRTRTAATLGSPGMLVAQIRWDQEGRCWFEPCFVAHEHAVILTEQAKTVEQTCPT